MKGINLEKDFGNILCVVPLPFKKAFILLLNIFVQNCIKVDVTVMCWPI